MNDTSISSLALTTALLRLVLETKDEARVDHGDPALSEEAARLEAALEEILRGPVPEEHLSRGTVDAVLSTLETSRLREGFTAHLAAQVIDSRKGRDFLDAFRSLNGARLMPGDPFPSVPFPCDRLSPDEQGQILQAFGKRTGDPKTRADPIDRTDHVRLAPPEVKDLRIRLQWAGWLEPIRAETRFAFGVTNTTQIREEFCIPEYLVAARHCFYGIQPKDCVEQERRISSLLQKAEEASASICVFPELSVTPAILKSLGERGLLSPLPLVIAGSYHREPEHRGPGYNICEVFSYGELVTSHEKFSDFHYKSVEHGGRCHEHLNRKDGASGFDLLVGPSCTAVVLICKDALGEAGALVKKLAPTLLLIPAMSEETADFELLARQLAHDPQAFTLVACAGSKIHVVHGLPHRDSPVLTSTYGAGDLVIADLSGPHQLFTIR